MIDIGTIVYLAWYDFAKKTEHICKGEVADNSLWEATLWHGYVNVRFQPPSLSGAIEHHFKEDQLSLTPDNIPHDACYLACATKSSAFEHDYTVRRGSATSASSPSDAWQQVQQFKYDHWDYAHGHLATDALDEYYQLWHDAIAVKRGFDISTSSVTVPCHSVARVTPSPVPQNETPSKSSTVTLSSHKKTTIPTESSVGKRKHTTGRIIYNDSIQTSLFD